MMFGLQWDPFDFFYCLEVEPQFDDEYEINYFYEVKRDGLVLTILVLPWESKIELSLRQENCERALCTFTLQVRGKVRHIHDKRGEYLELSNCLIFPNHTLYSDRNASVSDINQNWRVEISIKPQIQIRYL